MKKLFLIINAMLILILYSAALEASGGYGRGRYYDYRPPSHHYDRGWRPPYHRPPVVIQREIIYYPAPPRHNRYYGPSYYAPPPPPRYYYQSYSYGYTHDYRGERYYSQHDDSGRIVGGLLGATIGGFAGYGLSDGEPWATGLGAAAGVWLGHELAR